jgi:cyclopropane fatty-acyl-phospholipid synthase-like methyltransferase
MWAMNATPDPVRFFTARSRSYSRFIRLFRYQQGLRACFMTSPLLRSGMRVLDAGCGTGAVLLALHEAIVARGFAPGPLHGFDITPAMLDRLRASLRAGGIEGVELVQADVLALETLSAAWRNYDLIVSASMLEYVPPQQLGAALTGLRALLSGGGSLLLFITRDNWLMRPLIGRVWQSNLYTAQKLREAFAAVGFSVIEFRSFPPLYRYLALWGHVIEARH